MAEEIYVNKNGFKCVMSQLVKTNGIDPQEFERLKVQYGEDKQGFKLALKQCKVRAPQYAEE